MPHELPAAGWLHPLHLVTVRKRGIHVATLPVGAVIDPRRYTPQRLAAFDVSAFREELGRKRVLRAVVRYRAIAEERGGVQQQMTALMEREAAATEELAQPAHG